MLAILTCISKLKSESSDYIGGIGFENQLPWKIKKDMQYFKQLTTGNIVIMGRKTYESIGKALPGRTNVVLSHDFASKDAIVINKLSKLYDYIKANIKHKKIFIIGGEMLYKEFIKSELCSEIYLTYIDKEYTCDTFFPCIKSDYDLSYTSSEYYDSKEDAKFRFLKFKKKQISTNENEYLKLGKYILDNGYVKKNRTGVNTISTFSYQMRFDISQSVPLLTTKKVPWKMCIEELLWFLRGETDVKILQDKGIKIWNGNTSRQFLDNMGFYDVPEWDLRKGYGHQIRRYGPKEVDQLLYVENLLKTDPDSRRIMWNLWNANDLDEMVLTPCFLKDNYVITSNGYKRIDNVSKEDHILTHTGKYQKCLDIQKSIYHGDIYTFKFKNNPVDITCTKEHLFYIAEKRDKNKKKWIKARDIDVKKHVFCYKINDEDVPVKTNPKSESQLDNLDFWYLIGFLFNNNNVEQHTSSIKCLVYRNDIIDKIIDIASKYKLYRECNCNACYHGKEVVFTNELIANVLIKLLYNNEFIQRLSKNYIMSFLKGYEAQNKTITHGVEVLFLQRLYAKTGIICTFAYNEETCWKIQNLKPIRDEEWVYYSLSSIDVDMNNNGVEVYNLETKEDHTYTVSNVATHNCHNQVQFYVKDGKYLSAQLYCRSSDYFLGLPFNIFSYTVLVYILAKRCDLIPDELIVTLGDAHIYENHIPQVYEMLKRETRPLPILDLSDDLKNKAYEDITIDDFNLIGYFPQKVIKGKMAV